MKNLISLIVTLVALYFVFFQLDPWIVNSIMDAIPQTENILEWFKLIKIGIWVVLILLTGGLSIVLSIALGGIVHSIFEGIESQRKRKLRRK